jgi:hypothetical protein
MPYTAQFFAEKLSVPVEYFNPFRNVQIDPSVNLEELARVAHSLGEVVGLGLRNLAHCPVELNLIPASTRKMQSFNEKKPYLVATVFSLVALVAAMGLLFQKIAEVKADEIEVKVAQPLAKAQQQENNFKKAYGDLKSATNELGQLNTWLEYRYFWPDLLSEFRRVLVRTEQASQQELKTDVGVWIEQFMTTTPRVEAMEGAMQPPPGQYPGMVNDPYRRGPVGEDPYARRGMPPPGMTPEQATRYGATPAQPDANAAAAGLPPATNEVATITIKCRAVDLKDIRSDANTTIIYALQKALKDSTNYFNADHTEVVGQIMQDANGTFTFDVSVALKHPLKL